MTDKIINTTVEILGKFYSIRCQESELPYLQKAAAFLNQKMLEVQESGKAINLERIAIISALNISYLYLQQEQQSQQKNGFVDKINQRILQLQEKLEQAIHKTQEEWS